MTIYLEYKDEKSAKFWKIEVNNNTHTVTYGKIGTDGKGKTKTFETPELATKDAEKLIKSKTKKGYQKVGEAPQNSSSEENKALKTDKTPTKTIFISQEEAMERFDLEQYDPLSCLDYDTVLVFEGDTIIEADITHDSISTVFFNKDRKTEEELIIINGNLTVKGNLDISEEYPGLLVLGDLHCEVLCSNDNCINVTGDAFVKYAYDGNYNHGSITIDGTTHVPYLLNSDHDSGLNPGPKTILINYYGDYDDFFIYDYYAEDLPNILTKGIMDGDDFDAENFIARVKTGKSPFKSGVKPSRILVENEIKKLAKKNKTGEGLKELDLKEKKLLKLPNAIFELESLEHLKLEGNRFSVLPEALGKLHNLKELNLRATGVEKLPESIGLLKNLEVLNLNYCHNLKSLPEAIGDLTNLKKLTLWKFQGTIPKSISKLTHLEELDISSMYGQGAEPTDFPSWIFELTGLKKLLLNSNAFKSIPKEILSLSQLEVLNLNSALCFLEEELPDLSQLKNLKELECGGRGLGNSPYPKQELLQHFFKISSLEILNIDSFSTKDEWMPTPRVEENRAALKDDPIKLAEFESRLRINDSGNYFHIVRRKIAKEDFKGLDKLVNLKELDLRWNELEELPEEVFSLKRLEKVNTYGNELSSEAISALHELNPDIKTSY
jgi:predicted DNA-binding WGR domain protein/Leucine-rich repeat (LRR) protein